MTENAPPPAPQGAPENVTPPDNQAPAAAQGPGPESPAACLTQAGRQDRADTQADNQAQKERKARRRALLLAHAFTPAALLGAVFLLHNMERHDTGKGPNRVIDYGHYIYIPANANAEHLRLAAQLAMAKGWTNLNLHSSKGARHPALGALAQIAPQLRINPNPGIGSFYTDSVRTIVRAHFAKAAAHFAEMNAPVAAPQPPGPQ